MMKWQEVRDLEVRKSIAVALIFGAGVSLGLVLRQPTVADARETGQGRGGAGCVSVNGDVDGDGQILLTDAVAILGHLFRGNPTTLLPSCSTGVSSPLPDSGQTLCFDLDGNEIPCASETCPGQDGFYQTGCAREARFIDNGNGTVTDVCTGLMWERDTGNDRNRLDWCSALAHCQNLQFAGHADWRLPNVSELQSIVDYTRVAPTIDPVFDTVRSFHWSSTTGDGRFAAWNVNFNNGVVSYATKANDFHVRAVRTIQP